MAKRTWKQMFMSRWITFVALALVILLLFAFARATIQNYQISQEIQRLQKEAERLESKKMETLELLDYVKSPAFVEEKARTELNLVKEGEKMAIVKHENLPASRQGERDMLESLQRSNPHKWWDYFFTK